MYQEGLGICMIYEYESTPPRSLVIYYVDNEIVWPVRITFTMEVRRTYRGCQ
jgi:hypothetical protein